MKHLLPILLFFCLYGCTEPAQQENTLQQIATEFNKEGPRMVDSETRIEGIFIRGNKTIVYKYTLVNLLAQNADTVEFKKALRPGIISIVKLSPEMKTLREAGTNFEYEYWDKQNRFILRLKITPEDYK